MRSVCLGVSSTVLVLSLALFAPEAGAVSSVFAPAAAAKAKRMSPEQRAERQFLKDAAASSRFDVEAAHIALAKSSDAGVRSFAATLINHHTNAGNELQRMLHVRGMAPPMLGNDQRKTLNRLAKLQGAKFDRDFLEEVGLHYQQEDVLNFERAATLPAEPVLRAWIARNLPTLRYHLTHAEKIAPEDIRLARASAALPAAPIRTAAQIKSPVKVPPAALAAAAAATRSMGAAPAAVPTIFDNGQPGAQMGLASARPAGMTQMNVMQMGVKQ